MAFKSRLAGHLLLVSVSLGSGLVVVEITMRALVETTDVAWHRGDPLVGYALLPNQAGVYIRPGLRGTYRINGQGYNNDHEYSVRRVPGRFRIAVLGDSFVEAFQVERGARFFDLLEAKLKDAGMESEIYTFAVSGYGTAQEMLLLEHEVLQYQPDLVLVVFVINDPIDSSCSLFPGGERPCFDLDDEGQLRRTDGILHRPNRLGRVILRSAFARYVLVQGQVIDRVRMLLSRDTAAQSGGAFAPEPTPEWQAAWKVVDACLARMAALCAASGSRFLLLDQGSVSGGAGDRAIARDKDAPTRNLTQISRARGIEFFDLGPAFEKAAAAGGDPLFISGDGHWSPRGHRVVAEALLERILDALRGSPGEALPSGRDRRR